MALGTRRRRDLSAEQLMEITARLREFDFHGKRIRVLYEDGDAWLVLADVLQALGYKVKASHIAKTLRPEEISLKDIGAKNSLVNCINRTGLYAITRYANKPESDVLYEWSKENIFREQQGGLCTEDELTAKIYSLIGLLTPEEKVRLFASLMDATAIRRLQRRKM